MYFNIFADKSSGYPWGEFFKGVVSIAAAILIVRMTKKDGDAITTAADVIMKGTELLLRSVYLAFTLLEQFVQKYLWLPLALLGVTWLLFPDIVEDLFFLIYIGFRRYKSLLF